MGKLYEFSIEKEIKLFYPSKGNKLYNKIPYDPDTGNAHMLPKNVRFAEQCADVIRRKRDEIKKYPNDDR